MTEVKPVYEVKKGERLLDTVGDFRCLECGRSLARVLERDRQTVIGVRSPDGAEMYVTRAQVACPCGAERSFYSVPMSAVRLGIGDGGPP